MKVKRALISVSDKSGVVDFAKELSSLGIEIVSTGGTAKLLKENNISVKEVSELTKFPEIMDGRVKTLHPILFGGILAVRKNTSHMGQLKKHDLSQIDMVVVNLYPFEKTIAKKEASFEDAIENIDIGGPSLIRAAAKNHEDVAVVIDPSQYDEVLQQLKDNKLGLKPELLKKLATDAFVRTANYDTIISSYLLSKGEGEFPADLLLNYKKVSELRYGENKHQQAAFYSEINPGDSSIPKLKQHHGKQLSYNNILDIDGALGIIAEFDRPTATVLKHVNPCGVASADTISEAFKLALGADKTSAFGGIVGMNKSCDLETAKQISEFFVEVVIAPSYEPESLELLKKKKNIRIMEIPASEIKPNGNNFMVTVNGGLLVQSADNLLPKKEELKVVSKKKPTEQELKDLMFAWKVVKHVKSNAVVFAKNEHTTGIGAGQMSRVDSSFLAAKKSHGESKGSVMASDAFFPFRDAVDEAAKAGVTAIIQPGGSIRDQESIDAANEHNIAMIFCGVRAFKH
jgi:phosphoribosylaminoimidazolecarboxamide formyltransferase/IMP cyclohydrolase